MNILVWVSQFGSMRNVCQFLKIIVAGRGLWCRSRGGERTRAASGITPRQLKVWANSWVIVAADQKLTIKMSNLTISSLIVKDIFYDSTTTRS